MTPTSGDAGGSPVAALAALPDGVVRDFGDAVLRRVHIPASVSDRSVWAASVADAFTFLDERRSELSIRVLPAGTVALDGATPQGSVIQIACEDRDFIITSITEELHRNGLRSTRLLGVPFGSTRGADGALAAIGPARGSPHTEGLIEIELDAPLDDAHAADLVADLRRVLAAVFLATGDHEAMRRSILAAAQRTTRTAPVVFPADEVAESVALFDWLLDGHCVLLGTCRFPLVAGAFGEADDATALGLLRDPASPMRVPPAATPRRLLEVSRLPELSTVHRQAPIERFDLALVGDDGGIEAVGRLVCVFARRAEAWPVQNVPLLRWKLQQILEDEDAVEGSYDEQAVTSLFQALPKDELFRSSTEELHTTIRSLLAEDRDHRVRVLMQGEEGERAVGVLITMPSELYTRALRRRIEAFLLAQLDGERVDVDLSMSGSADTVARFLVHLPEGMAMPTGLDAVAREVQLLCRTWEQELAVLLRPTEGDRAAELASVWSDRLPASYRDAVDPADATDDVLVLDGLAASTDASMRVRMSSLPDDQARLTVASSGEVVELSRLLPILESIGLWATDELHWDVGGLGLHRVTVRRRDGGPIDEQVDGPRLCDAFLALWDGRADVDPLNRLVAVASMPWADVAVLRAYRRYRRQVDHRFTEGYVDDVLVDHPAVAKGIIALFVARFGPSGPDQPAIEALSAELAAACDRVTRLDHDRILRGMVGTVSATLRTNLHLRPAGPLALKLDPSLVPDVPHPVPYREIFVHGPAVEGVHLRAGPVARGGLRFSDRPEDFRSEVLDLMRTQVLKNALIVPTGAKGGFVLRGPSLLAAPADVPSAVRAAYESFVSGLLDLTDDLRGDTVVPVPGRLDGDDPYLVVAADKGTAAFSDVSNKIAVDRGFWLGDAFASGGSVGYDHRALGITARGAWVAVARHFQEVGVDVATDPFTVAGVGDMSGDVFGNGMLLSDQIHLVAAFDHRDIFLDPHPDAGRALTERRRLQGLSGSSWQDYDRAAISDGGGVVSRALKKVELSAQVRDVLRIPDESLTPPELIQAILRAPVDLLYLGGIGTYVRCSAEADGELDDRANAEVRVTAAEMRARVVGEGANLGLTQRARIEYARRGGRINMDAIDNSAGVDTSDHEVNIKILVDLAIDAGDVARADRPGVLAGVTDDVVTMVLADSADQCDALRRARDASAGAIEAFEAAQGQLVAAGIVDPVIESLPDAAEYDARRVAGAGLTRPELAVLLAGAKRWVKAEVLASQLPDEPATRDVLVSYFPPSMADAYGHLLDRHRLRRELIASGVANDLVDHLGPTAAADLSREFGVGPAEVAAAYWVARGVADGPSLWAALAAAATAASAPADATGDVLDPGLAVAALLEQLTRQELVARRRGPEAGEAHDVGGRIAEGRLVFEQLRATLPSLVRPAAERARALRLERLQAGGLPAALAADLAMLDELTMTGDVADLVRSSRRPPGAVAAAFLEVSDHLGIDRVQAALLEATPADEWSRKARQGLLDDIADLRRRATRAALASADGEVPGDGTAADGVAAARRWLATRSVDVAAANTVVDEVDREGAGLDGLSVAVRALRGVLR